MNVIKIRTCSLKRWINSLTSKLWNGALVTPTPARICPNTRQSWSITSPIPRNSELHYNDVIMSTMASEITSLTIVYSTVYSRRRSKKTSKLRVTGLCAVNSPGTGEFTAQRDSNAENVAIWWRHHVDCQPHRKHVITHLLLKPEYFRRIRSRLWLLLSWLLASHRQDMSRHGIESAEQTDLCLPQGNISTILGIEKR